MNPTFSVLIPSRNNRERLEATLESVAHVRFDPSRIEVIVVDDGSTDGTWEAFHDREYPFAFRMHRESHANQSAATNAAARRATGTYLLSSASDILFHPDLLRRHLAWHEAREGGPVVVLGDLPYADHLDVTPFMFYLVNGGYQFAYYLIKDPMRVPPNFLYAPNFSVERELFERVGGFDERFPFGCQDTDLGIRLIEAGARVIYDCAAVGYHNHPVDLSGYLSRQDKAGRALVHLEIKHPDHEGGLHVWDQAIQHYLMYSDVAYDRDSDTIARIEATLARTALPYGPLWIEAFCGGKPFLEFDDGERQVLRLVDALFGAYNRILGFHWSRAYVDESIRVHGVERIRRRVHGRLAKAQASRQIWRVIRRRMSEHDLDPPPASPAPVEGAWVLHDVPDYLCAARFLEPFENPPAGRCNRQVVIVVDPDSVSPGERDRLSGIADVVVAEDTDAGIFEALRRCRCDTVVFQSARVEPVHSGAPTIAERLLQRVPDLAVVGGNVENGPGPSRRYGFRRDGGVLATETPPAGVTPVDVAIPELLVLRRSAARSLIDGRPRGSQPWQFQLCAAAAAQRGRTVHVAELAVTRRTPHGGAERVD